AILVPTRAGLRRTLSRALSPEGARLSRLLPHHQLSAYGGDDPVLRAYESATAQHAATPPEVLEAAGLKGALDLPERGSLLAGLCGLAVPMVSAGSVLGVMTFARAGAEPRPFDADDVSLACELAARAGLALDNANRYQEEHRVAEVLQRAVLPDSLPRLGGFTLDAEYRPGAAGSFAGGDWYDALVLGDGRLLLSVGDVMGKGPTAAALMGQVRSAIRSYGVEDHRPSRILERLDRLFQLVGEERLVSVVVAVLDPAIGSVELSNAGHPPALMVSSDGGARVLDQARSIIVGAGGPPPRRTDAHFVIGPGETLVVYSDGLIERRGEPLTRGLSRLLDTLRKESARWPTWHPGSACAIADSLLGSLPRTDDVVVMTLHRVAEETVPRAGPDSVLSSELLLSAALDSPSGARRFVTGRLLHRHPLVAERAAVLVSELVTNVVRHAEGELRVVVSELPSGVVRVEVADHSPELPEKKELDPLSDDGRGLRLMEALADRWGHRRDPNGRFAKIVWFEVGRERQDYPASTAAPGYLPGPGAQLRAPVEAGGIGAAPSAR
ncbi:MAG: ATP-binding SpoIIE family protein phosphatase, partial [Acidimicrobiales bacterium]